MSWDVMIFSVRGTSQPSAEELQESDLEPLGSASEVRERISKILDPVDWSDPAWGLYEAHGLSIEFSVGESDPVESMTLHVRGRGDAISTVVKLAGHYRWSALDCSTGEFLDLENPSPEGWEGFQSFRDRAIKQIDGDDA